MMKTAWPGFKPIAKPGRQKKVVAPAGKASEGGDAANEPPHDDYLTEIAMRIGFIGLGNMGNPMAAHLIKAGFSLTVHDLRRSTAEHLLELGAHVEQIFRRAKVKYGQDKGEMHVVKLLEDLLDTPLRVPGF